MAIEIKYMCQNCGMETKWVFDEEEETLHPNSLLGCPGAQCARIHDISVREVDQDRAEQIKDKDYSL